VGGGGERAHRWRSPRSPTAAVYDLRYIVNRAGTFDLKDYLVADDGSALDGIA
jgi:hypothetical protein